MLIDSHCHLDSPEFEADREAVIGRALEAGVSKMVAVGTGNGPPDLDAGVRLADRHDCLYATAGVHPHEASKADSDSWRRILDLARHHPKVIAIGEIGLDYHYDFSPREVQRTVFSTQLALAVETRTPVIIHTREAWEDTFALLEREWAPHGLPGIMHCFSGGPPEARRSLEMGFYLSFGGIVTFPKAAYIQQAAREAPQDRILVETDAPYLAPVPKRGTRNEPAFVVHTAANLAQLRGVPAEEIARVTTTNFERLFGRRV